MVGECGEFSFRLVQLSPYERLGSSMNVSHKRQTSYVDRVGSLLAIWPESIRPSNSKHGYTPAITTHDARPVMVIGVGSALTV